MAFEDKYGILRLVAARHPEEKPIDKTNQGFWNGLGQNIHKKGRKASAALGDRKSLSKKDGAAKQLSNT